MEFKPEETLKKLAKDVTDAAQPYIDKVEPVAQDLFDKAEPVLNLVKELFSRNTHKLIGLWFKSLRLRSIFRKFILLRFIFYLIGICFAHGYPPFS